MPTALISTPHPIPWYRQFPNESRGWSNWKFIFNNVDQPYDFVVAFDDLHQMIAPPEQRENTIHIATEPPTVRQYHPLYLQQFGLSLGMDERNQHQNTLFTQPGLNWHLGWNPASGNAAGAMSFDELSALGNEPKTKLISIITSDKAFTPEHKRRLEFALRLKEHFGDRIDFFGRNIRPMTDKLEALREYRFHVVLENSVFPHYFSEKLSDCLIAGSYPFYYGCPNLNEYVPDDSFSRIDIEDFEGAVQSIEQAMSNSFDTVRRPALQEAKRLIMHEHNLFPMLSRILNRAVISDLRPKEQTLALDSMLLPFESRRFKEIAGLVPPLSLRKRVKRRIKSILKRNWSGCR